MKENVQTEPDLAQTKETTTLAVLVSTKNNVITARHRHEGQDQNVRLAS